MLTSWHSRQSINAHPKSSHHAPRTPDGSAIALRTHPHPRAGGGSATDRHEAIKRQSGEAAHRPVVQM